MKTPTVLVVEHEPEIADAVVARLRTEGFVAESVGDGESAVRRCRRLRPDLVVLDLVLPAIDGLEVCRRIQSDRRWLLGVVACAGLAVLLVADVVDPEAFIVRHNVARAASGAEVDTWYLGQLSDDLQAAVAATATRLAWPR